MRIFIILLVIILTATSSVFAERIQLTCAMMPSLAQTNAECKSDNPHIFTNFPYHVPAGKFFCATDYILSNKFPYDPPAYNTNMRTMYFAVTGFSVAAHHPQVSLRTPIVYGPGSEIVGWILNSMTENQNIYAYMLGYLANDSNC